MFPNGSVHNVFYASEKKIYEEMFLYFRITNPPQLGIIFNMDGLEYNLS